MALRSEDFDAVPESARAVRLFVGDALRGVPRQDDIVLAASELASNVIRHARTEFSVRVAIEGDLCRMEVSDGSSIIPAVEDLSKRRWGLRLIEAVSDRWGIESTDTGKTVWVEFTTAALDDR